MSYNIYSTENVIKNVSKLLIKGWSENDIKAMLLWSDKTEKDIEYIVRRAKENNAKSIDERSKK